jgi:hypothetical protein
MKLSPSDTYKITIGTSGSFSLQPSYSTPPPPPASSLSTPTVDSSVYDADYYRSSNYADYLERADRYKKTSFELINLFRSINLIDRKSLVVDFGCAVGFLIDGFKELGYNNTIGVEISEWAREQSRLKGHSVFEDVSEISPNLTPDLLLSLDVFEHMCDADVARVIETLKPKSMIVRIPSSVDGGKTFGLEVSRADPTHINCKTKEQWIEFFTSFGYHTFLKLNLYTVYDTPSVTCLLIL